MPRSDGRPPGRPSANTATTKAQDKPLPPLPDGIEDPYKDERARLSRTKKLRDVELTSLGLSTIEPVHIDQLRRDLGMEDVGKSI